MASSGEQTLAEPSKLTDRQPAPRGSTPEFYRWQAPDEGLAAIIPFDFIDRLGYDVMRGFGAVPRRGAEVGGLVLGKWTEAGEVRIEDYLLAPCSHARGPSYLLTGEEEENLKEIIRQARSGTLEVVGLFRSNTREQLELGDEDLERLEKHFGGEAAIFLLIRPFATRPPQAAILYRRNGEFPRQPPAEPFIFRRRELGGGRPAPRPKGAPPEDGETPAQAGDPGTAAESSAPKETPVPAGLTPAVPRSETSRKLEQEPRTRSTWIWIPLSFIFLLLGIVMGFQIALSFRPPATAATASAPYDLAVSVTDFQGNLHLRWNAEAPAILQSTRGLLHIRDGDNVKSVTLSREDLLRGGVLYRNSTNKVQLRLEVFLDERTSLSESTEITVLPSP